MRNSKADIARRYYAEIWNAGDLSVADQLVSPDVVVNGSPIGIQGVREIIAGIRGSFPDVHFTLEEVLEVGDRVVVRFRSRGTHMGTYLNIAPTGREVTYTGIVIWRVANGKFVEHWSNVDVYGIVEQITMAAE